MSDLPLPADLARWPENVFELLGVVLGTDEKGLKRAYQKLIKTYRPERYPEEFRRIREAYDTALSITEWMASVGDLPSIEKSAAEQGSVPPVAEGASMEQSAIPNSADVAPTAANGRPTSVEPTYEARLAAAWAPAVGGDSAAAYRELDALRSATPTRHEAYLGLYWLLRLSARLDAERQPCDWLIACMEKATASRGAAVELYRRELERRPAEALTPRCTTLLRETLLSGPISLLADWRWKAAVRSNAWALIREDLAVLRRSRVAYDASVWMRVLWTAVECFCWSDAESAKALTAECMQDLEQFGNAQESNYDSLTQLDYLRETAEVVKKLRDEGVSPAFCNLIAGSWSLQALDSYVEICAFVAPWIDDPAELLILLSEVAGKGPAALSRFGQLVQQVQTETERNGESFWTLETARGVVVDFLDVPTLKQGYTSEFRLRLLKFCLYHQLAPEAVAQVMAENEFYASINARPAEEIARDWPLRFTYQTLRLVTL
ncbi:MAG: J domain-containing protein [Planctomycetia bacterium]|nr:J domain-containing protein [Planctomycetia bacterium]